MVLGKTLRGDKHEKGLKFARPTSRGSSNGSDGTSTPKKKWEAKSRKFESGERNESLAEGNRGLKSLNLDKKRKKNDAGMITNEGRDYDQNAGRPKRKSISIVRKDKRGDNIGEEKQTTKEKPYKFERSTQNASLPGRKNYRQMEFMDKRKPGASVMTKSIKDEGVSDKPQRNSRSKFKVTNQSGQEQISPGRTSKKRRRIRIDRYDISNKRLDDGIADNNSFQKREEDSKSSEVKLSQNAQFRAIVPSPSILSFVEDNLLGRRREIEFRRAGYNIELSAPLDNIPHSSSSERERIEEPVFRNKLTFFAAAKISSSFPPPELPEIAFAGRSNVGKSSLLNALTRQWGVVRTSDKPGLTQTINFFQLASKLCLVDLPGYGFAYAKEEVKEAWEELVKEYVSTRVGLKRVCLLVDTKWGMKPRDHELIDLMERSQTKYQIVLTKTDMVFPIDVARRAMQIEESLKAKKLAVQPVMMVSSKTGAGVRSLRTALTKIARFVKP